MNKVFKIFAYAFAVILLCGVTASCKKDDDKKDKTAEETIFMFFPYSGLERETTENVRNMEQALRMRGGLNGKRIIVYKARSTSRASLFEIKCTKDSCYEQDIDNDIAMTFSSKNQSAVIADLQRLLQQVKSEAPAKGYSMIIGSHGNGWLEAMNDLSSFNHAHAKSANGPKKAFGSASSLYQIDNTSLATALQNENIHLNYLMFDACYMCNIETVYDFHNVCDYFIGSPNEILMHGLPYEIVGDALLKHDYRAVVDGFYDYYSSTYGSLSVIDCSKVDDMVAIVQDINNTCLNPDGELNMVQKMDGISPTMFFDMQDYMDKFCTDKAKLERLSAKIKQLVVHTRTTEYAFTAFTSSNLIKIDTFCGIATSQPTRNADALEKLKSSAWWTATH